VAPAVEAEAEGGGASPQAPAAAVAAAAAAAAEAEAKEPAPPNWNAELKNLEAVASNLELADESVLDDLEEKLLLFEAVNMVPSGYGRPYRVLPSFFSFLFFFYRSPIIWQCQNS